MAILTPQSPDSRSHSPATFLQFSRLPRTRRATASSWRCRYPKPSCCSSLSITYSASRSTANWPGNFHQPSPQSWWPLASKPRSARGPWPPCAIALPCCPPRTGSSTWPIPASSLQFAPCSAARRGSRLNAASAHARRLRSPWLSWRPCWPLATTAWKEFGIAPYSAPGSLVAVAGAARSPLLLVGGLRLAVHSRVAGISLARMNKGGDDPEKLRDMPFHWKATLELLKLGRHITLRKG